MNYSPDLTVATVKMVLSLALVLAILWLVHRWMKRTVSAGRIGAQGRLIKVLGSHHLGMKKSIAVVRVPGSVLVLGIGTEQVNLLSSIDDPAILADLEPSETSSGVVGFGEQLQRLLRGGRNQSAESAINEDQGRG